MQLYNTLTRQVEPLTFVDNIVRMYVCGITPYDTSHLGHARVAVIYDTLRRCLESQGLDVRYVQNITDIDDPLFERARRDGVSWQTLAREQTDRYLHALEQLNVRMPDQLIRVTDVVSDMLPLIKQLIDLGHAYVRNGAVYYHAASFPDFGAIAHADRATLLEMANEMGNDPDDPNKHAPLDFVLWQPSAPDEPAWDSPWGPGRPGWHIECSTIATKYLGSHIDIHGGGTDLIFPHHACEIAQAEPVTGAPFVRYWMHTGMVTMGSTKMSKSLGNMVFVNDLLQEYSAAAVRMAILSCPYRETLEYRSSDFDAATRRLALVTEALARADRSSLAVDGEITRAQFYAALADNFNTSAAIDVLCGFAEEVLGAPEGTDASTGSVLHEMCDVLGMDVQRVHKENQRRIGGKY